MQGELGETKQKLDKTAQELTETKSKLVSTEIELRDANVQLLEEAEQRTLLERSVRILRQEMEDLLQREMEELASKVAQEAKAAEEVHSNPPQEESEDTSYCERADERSTADSSIPESLDQTEQHSEATDDEACSQAEDTVLRPDSRDFTCGTESDARVRAALSVKDGPAQRRPIPTLADAIPTSSWSTMLSSWSCSSSRSNQCARACVTYTCGVPVH